jgi:hypothetical protein
VQFLAFSAKLEISSDRAPQEERRELQSTFTLSSIATNGINPRCRADQAPGWHLCRHHPARLLQEDGPGSFAFAGVIDGVRLRALIKPTGTLRYTFQAKARSPNLARTKNPVYATLTIGDDQRRDLGHGRDFPLKPDHANARRPASRAAPGQTSIAASACARAAACRGR